MPDRNNFTFYRYFTPLSKGACAAFLVVGLLGLLDLSAPVARAHDFVAQEVGVEENRSPADLGVHTEARVLEDVIERRDGNGPNFRLVEFTGRLRVARSDRAWRRYLLIPSLAAARLVENSPSSGGATLWEGSERGRSGRVAFIILSAAGVEMLLSHSHPEYVVAADLRSGSAGWSSLPLNFRTMPAPISYRSFVDTDTLPVLRGVGQYFSVYVARNGLQQVADLLRIGVSSADSLMAGVGIDVRKDWWSGRLTENYLGSLYYCRKLSSTQSCWGGQFLLAFDGVNPEPELVGLGGMLVAF